MVFIDEKKIQHAFLEEVSELLEKLNHNLLELEESPQDKNVINEIFRLTHSIKSESALVGFKNISTIAHKMEDIFEKVRREVLIVDRNIMDALFLAYDRIMFLIAAVQKDEKESDYDISDVINPLLEILKEKPSSKKDEPKKEEKKEQPVKSQEESFATKLVVTESVIKELKNVTFTEPEKSMIEEGLQKGETFYKIQFHLENDCDMRYPRAYLVYNNFCNNGNVVKTVPDVQQETEDEKFSEVDLYFLSNISNKKIIECAEVDQVDRLNIIKIDNAAIKSLLGIVSLEDGLVSQEEIAESEKLEKEWAEKYVKEMSKSAEEKETKKIQEEVIISKEKIEAEKKEKEEKKEEKKKDISQSKVQQELQKQTIRVDIERLDTLMNLVGELIINRSRFMQIHDKISEQTPISEIKADLEDACNELDRIADLMQMGMMQARMVPIGNVFSKFPRMVRDLANKLHKSVDLEIIGETTEIDRTVIELIADPLTHLIRNCIDHGLETPEEREKLNKPRTGKVILKAYQEGSSIYIEVSDDGRGINVESVKEKAIEKGLITAQQANSLPVSEILNFIFEPGFSTKKEITDTSGRGVGMDVVKTQIEKLRGRVDIHTTQGEGTKFVIVLPLTLTIVEALLVNVQKNIFAIPITVVEETIKVNKSEIKEFDDYQVYNLRNETLAVIYLSDLVGIEREDTNKEVFIVVVSFERRKIGLVVNDLMGEQDIVIKALDEVLRNNQGIAGATVLGDGRIALILDTSTLVKAALREINKLAEKYDFYSDDNVSYGLNQLYDALNKAGQTIKKKEEKKNNIKSEDNKDNLNENITAIKDEEKYLNEINMALQDIGAKVDIPNKK